MFINSTKYKYYLKIIFLICLSLPILPNITLSDPTKFIIWENIDTRKSFPKVKYDNDTISDSFGIQIKKKNKNINSNFTLNFIDNKQFTLDQSRIEYVNQNIKTGIGKINRNWSFSPNTSLILSKNARSSNSIYFDIHNNYGSKNLLFSWVGPWSLETFNSILSNPDAPKNSMLLGLRLITEPVDNLQIEFVKTAQWGGAGYSTNISSISAAMFGNTNEHKYAHINQVAGFGLSYKTELFNTPLKIYGQFVGEDEAGSLPSCYMYMFGNELDFKSMNYPTKIGYEIVDTRIGFTKNMNCGPNTAYNNSVYKYTNYGTSIGAPIDTEGKLIDIWGTTAVSKNTNINYSIKNVLINDTDWNNHRLSSNRQKGWVSFIGASWLLNSLKLESGISFQSFSLDKINSPKGINLNFHSKYTF